MEKLKANGLTFAADICGDGDTVALLLHGFPECRQTWHRQFESLAALGWKVVAPDLRGYGESDRPRGRRAYRIDCLIDDVTGLFEAAGAKRKILIGHDWGGMIAWFTALKGVPLDGLVVMNAPHPTIFNQAIQTWDQRRRSWYVLFFLLPLLPELQLTWNKGRGLIAALCRQSANFEPELLETYRRNILRPGAATAMLNYYRENAVGLPAPKDGDTPIKVPTLMIWGDGDVALSPALMDGNESFVSDFSLVRLVGASHWVQQDAPRAVNEAIQNWALRKGLSLETR